MAEIANRLVPGRHLEGKCCQGLGMNKSTSPWSPDNLRLVEPSLWPSSLQVIWALFPALLRTFPQKEVPGCWNYLFGLAWGGAGLSSINRRSKELWLLLLPVPLPRLSAIVVRSASLSTTAVCVTMAPWTLTKNVPHLRRKCHRQHWQFF